jgi:hypothetical protein
MVRKNRQTGILASLSMRFVALTLALVFAAVPITAEICETRCVEHGFHSEIASGGAHHHHDFTTSEHGAYRTATQTTSSAGSTLATSISHDCCFSLAVLTESRATSHQTTLSAALSLANIEAMTGDASQRAYIDHRHRPPTLGRSLSQLRV